MHVLDSMDWGTVSATGLLGWYLWYSTKVLLPRHEDRIVKMQETCGDELRKQRDHYETLLSDMQDKHESRHREIVSSLEKIAMKLDK